MTPRVMQPKEEDLGVQLCARGALITWKHYGIPHHFGRENCLFFPTFEVGEGSGDNHFLSSCIQLADKTSAQRNSFDNLGNIFITFPAEVKLKAATKPELMPHYPHYRLCWESLA